MIIIDNVPCKYIKEFPTKIEFILLHKLIDNEGYRNYFLKNKNNDKYKILDNSCFELGESLNADLLVDWAEKINASEIIIPDCYKNKNKTIELFDQFVVRDDIEFFNLMAVPQGKNNEELRRCTEYMMENPKVTCIGFNKLWSRDKFHTIHRGNKLQHQIDVLGATNKLNMHVLGCQDLDDYFLIKNLMGVRSFDTRIMSKIVCGKNDIWEEELTKEQKTILKRLIYK